MIRFFPFSPSRLALAYIALSVFVLALFAIPLWYAWRVNLSTFKEYVQGEELQRLVEVFHSEGAKGLATAMESQASSLPGDEIMVFADASKSRLAGNLPAWPAEVPDAPGTYGLVLGLSNGSTMRIVATHARLPGGYHLLLGRESVRFESLVDRFWYGLAGAMGVVLVLGAAFAALIRRSLLSEVHEISRTASAIVEGDLSRRIATRGGSDELDTLARTVNGMLEQLARQNVLLASEIAMRRQTEQALHRAHDDLEGLVEERTDQLARVNQSLLRSEAYLAEAQRLSHTGSWAFNVVTKQIVHWSQEHFHIFGFDSEQGMPSFETLLQRIHPEDRARAAEVIQRAVRERTDYEVDWRIVPPDGGIKYIHAEGHPVFNSSGELVESVGTVMDVTERQRAEEERQAHLWFLESMDQVNRAIQGTNDLEKMMSDVLDTVLSIFNCDRAWLVYPCDPEAASWKVPMEHARPDFPGVFTLGLDLPVDPESAKVFKTVRASSSPVRFGPASEHPLPAEIAKRFSIQSIIAMAIYPKGDKPYLLGLHQCSYPRVWTPQEERLFQEIGRRLEDALTSLLMFRNQGESERKLEEAQRLAHVGYWERDADTDLITWSDETYRIFGMGPRERILNLAQLPELIHREDKQSVVKAVAEALRGGPRYDIEYRVVRPNGEIRLVHSQGDVMRDDSGRPCRMFGTVQDITERQRAEEELRRSEADLRKVQAELAHVTRLTTMGELTASIAHEVNQPLTAVITNANASLRWLAAATPNLDEARQAVGRIVRDGNRAGAVIARIRALVEKTDTEKVPLDINQTVHEVVILMQNEAVRKGVALRTDLACDVPPVLGDRVQLQQVLLNLFMNGVEAMASMAERPRELLISSRPHEPDKVLVAVQDSGVGIDQENLEKIFDAFYTTKSQGMGMGLAISRSIVENHGGQLWAVPNEGVGATFQFTVLKCP